MKFNQADEFTRRQFLSNVAKSALGVSLLPMMGTTVAHGETYVPNRAKAAKSVIFLNMSGGMSHLDTFDIKPNAAETIRGPIKGLQTTADGMMISEYLPRLAKQGHQLCLVNGMNTNQGAHEQGQYFMQRSYRLIGTITHPALGCWVMRLAGKRNQNIPGYVSISGDPNTITSGFMGAKFAGVPIGEPQAGLQDSKLASGVSQNDFDQRLKLADQLNKSFHNKFSNPVLREHQGLYSDALRLMKSEDLKAFDIDAEPTEVKELYGGGRFGQGCLLARRLVEHGVRFVQVSLGGWDTHYDNFTAVEARCKELDAGFAALVQDLDRRGLLGETLIALGTEFGRTPEIVSEHKDGRDHYPVAYSCVLAGGGIKGGTKHGKTDAKGMKVEEGQTTVMDFNATIAYALGLPLDLVVTSPSGRPFTVADKGKPLANLFA